MKTAQWLRTRDVAHILDMCPDDVVVLAQKGTIEARKIGRLWFYDRASVLQYRRQMAKRRAA